MIKKIKNFLAKRRRGFSYDETWNLDAVLAEIIVKALRAYKEDANHGWFPAELSSLEEWMNIIDRMILGFSNLAEWTEGDELHDYKETTDEALRLFAKYFKNLWW